MGKIALCIKFVRDRRLNEMLSEFLLARDDCHWPLPSYLNRAYNHGFFIIQSLCTCTGLTNFNLYSARIMMLLLTDSM